MSGQFLEYTDRQLEYIKEKDEKLARVIDRAGRLTRRINPDLYSALVDSIIGQQISTAAHNSIRDRAREKFGLWQADKVAEIPDEELKSVGLSWRKVEYIKGITQAVVSGKLDINGLKDKDDEEVIKRLTELKGVGRWTAEMMLTFSLARPDIISFGDLGIRRGIMKVYGLEELSEEEFHRLTDKFAPYRSVAALYFWHAASVNFELKQ